MTADHQQKLQSVMGACTLASVVQHKDARIHTHTRARAHAHAQSLSQLDEHSLPVCFALCDCEGREKEGRKVAGSDLSR